MKPTKFRAWDTQEKRWFPKNQHEEWINVSSAGEVVYGYEDGGPELGEGRFQISWFTGLCDKNGTEIYEGDVINYGDYTDGSGPCNYVVEWGAEGAAFEGRAIHEKDMTSFLDPSGAVIGNVHENPELLK